VASLLNRALLLVREGVEGFGAKKSSTGVNCSALLPVSSTTSLLLVTSARFYRG